MSAQIDSGEGGQDFELNLAPIIDCFVVLITYLLVTASFITLTALDVGVSAFGDPSTQPPPPAGPPPMTMTMELTTTQKLVLKVSGGTLAEEIIVNIEPKENTWDLQLLEKRLLQAQKKWPSLTEVSVSAEPTVEYKQIIKIIRETQKTIKKVFISG